MACVDLEPMREDIFCELMLFTSTTETWCADSFSAEIYKGHDEIFGYFQEVTLERVARIYEQRIVNMQRECRGKTAVGRSHSFSPVPRCSNDRAIVRTVNSPLVSRADVCSPVCCLNPPQSFVLLLKQFG